MQFIMLYEDRTKYMILGSVDHHGQIYDSMGTNICSSHGSSPDHFNDGVTLHDIMSNMRKFHMHHIKLK
jgi:hypothetical protein